MKTTLYVVVALILSVCLLLVGCQSASSTAETSTEDEGSAATSEAAVTDGSAETASGEGQVYYMVTFLSGSDYWKGCWLGAKEATEMYGATLEYTGCAEYDINAQITVFEQVVAKKPDGILLCPMQADAFVDSINAAVEQGIKVVTFSSDAPDSKRLSFICADNIAEGKIGADTLAEALGEEGQIGIVNRPGQDNLDKRVMGFENRIAEAYPNLEIVSYVNGEGNEQTAAEVTASMLQAHPEIDAIYTIAGEEGIGIASAVEESGLDVKIFCFDADTAVLDLIKDGKIYATGAANTYNAGYWAAVMSFTAANNLCDPIGDWAEAARSPLPLFVDSGTDVVTAQNADYYYVDIEIK